MSAGRLSGKVAVVTGAAEGIGAGIAQCFIDAGATVVLTDIQHEKGARRAAELGPNASFIAHDVTQEASWDAVVAQVMARHGRLTTLVNNAGLGGVVGNIEQETLERWRRVQAINCESIFIGCKAVINPMRLGGGGSIINISSTSGLKNWALFTAYSTSKAAMTMLTRCVAQHCAESKSKIRCNSVHPGAIRTPNFERLVSAADPSTASVLEDFAAKNPCFSVGNVADIGHAAVYLASDESAFVNGAQFVVDGGALL